MNPATDHRMPYAELIQDTRHRWSWALWDENDDPLAMSAITYDDKLEAANALKRVRELLPEAPVIIYTERKANRRDQYINKRLDEFT